MRISIFLLALISIRPMAFAKSENYIPSHFNIYISSFAGKSYEVTMEKGVLYYTSYNNEHKGPKEIKIEPTSEEWKAFRQDLDALKISKWNDNYISSTNKKGQKWSIDIAYENQKIRVQGKNKYPDEEGKAFEGDIPTKTFDRYLAAVGNLIHQAFR